MVLEPDSSLDMTAGLRLRSFWSETERTEFLTLWTQRIAYMWHHAKNTDAYIHTQGNVHSILFFFFLHKKRDVKGLHGSIVTCCTSTCKKRCCDTLKAAATQIKVRTAVWFISVRESDFIFYLFLHECIWIHMRGQTLVGHQVPQDLLRFIVIPFYF